MAPSTEFLTSLVTLLLAVVAALVSALGWVMRKKADKTDLEALQVHTETEFQRVDAALAHLAETTAQGFQNVFALAQAREKAQADLLVAYRAETTEFHREQRQRDAEQSARINSLIDVMLESKK